MIPYSDCDFLKGDITDLAVSSNNALVASASNDFIIRVVGFFHILLTLINLLILSR